MPRIGRSTLAFWIHAVEYLRGVGYTITGLLIDMRSHEAPSLESITFVKVLLDIGNLGSSIVSLGATRGGDWQQLGDLFENQFCLDCDGNLLPVTIPIDEHWRAAGAGVVHQAFNHSDGIVTTWRLDKPVWNVQRNLRLTRSLGSQINLMLINVIVLYKY